MEKEYIRRINQALVFIDEHLSGPLSLDLVADSSHYSPFHFHRIFKAVIGETLNAYINRRRLEKAASVLIKNQDLPLAELADSLGFNSPSSFSRAFHSFFGMSPSAFKEASLGPYSKIRKVESKNGKEPLEFEAYLSNVEEHIHWMKQNAEVSINAFPDFLLAFVSHMGPFSGIGEAYGKLMRWATPKGLVDRPEVQTMTVYHEDPNITDVSKLRQSAALVLETPVKAGGEVGMMTVRGGRYAVGRFRIRHNDFERAWQGMFVWINEHGYVPDEKDCFERYTTSAQQRDPGNRQVEICIPIK